MMTARIAPKARGIEYTADTVVQGEGIKRLFYKMVEMVEKAVAKTF